MKRRAQNAIEITPDDHLIFRLLNKPSVASFNLPNRKLALFPFMRLCWEVLASEDDVGEMTGSGTIDYK